MMRGRPDRRRAGVRPRSSWPSSARSRTPPSACMKTAGFEYVAVPPESNEKSQVQRRRSTCRRTSSPSSTATASARSTGPRRREATTPTRTPRSARRCRRPPQKAYDKALNGRARGSGERGRVAKDGSAARPRSPTWAAAARPAEEVYGKRDEKMADFKKFDSLFKDIEALRKRIDSDQRVVDATAPGPTAWPTPGHSGFKKLDDAREQISKKLDELTGATRTAQQGRGPAIGDRAAVVRQGRRGQAGRPAQVRDRARQGGSGLQGQKFDEPYKEAQYELEKEFVEAEQDRARAVPRHDGGAVTASPKSRRRVLVGVSAVATLSLGVGVAAGQPDRCRRRTRPRRPRRRRRRRSPCRWRRRRCPARSSAGETPRSTAR